MKESIKTKLTDTKEFLYEHRKALLGITLSIVLGSAAGVVVYKRGLLTGMNSAAFSMAAAIRCDSDKAGKWVNKVVEESWTPEWTKVLDEYALKEWEPFYKEFLKEGVA